MSYHITILITEDKVCLALSVCLLELLLEAHGGDECDQVKHGRRVR